jgi:Cu/Ag efflux protein CusF
MKTTQSSITVGLLALTLSFGAQVNVLAAETHADHDHSTPEDMQKHQELLQKDAQTAQATSDAMSDGEVRKVDKSAAKVTIKHGPLPKLGMGAMTMVFRVADPAMLDKLKAGDKIRFQAESVNGALTVTKIE